ncbi:uncharacterized protein LOC111088100 [Limulus polyphemus]|uniref:Uncharacterized protein LOC111088100 n=1 Tax=Limulus polyphemus TaxID=6850 RepID=A0ABM1TA69_LIMPO|nr:uncharacterized protein LOC111088100 [Limulus polyphemus]
MLVGKAPEVQFFYVVSVDFEKAFERVYYENFIEVLHQVDAAQSYIRILNNLYFNHEAEVRIDRELRSWPAVKRVVRRRCMLPLTLYNLNTEWLMRGVITATVVTNLREILSVIIGSLDITLMDESEGEIQQLLDNLVDKEKKYGLGITANKVRPF